MQKFYPRALKMALAHYRSVARRSEPKYPDFKKQQEACKVSIAHIQLLLKLGRELMADHAEGAGMEQEDLQKLIETAQHEIAGYDVKDGA